MAFVIRQFGSWDRYKAAEDGSYIGIDYMSGGYPFWRKHLDGSVVWLYLSDAKRAIRTLHELLKFDKEQTGQVTFKLFKLTLTEITDEHPI